MKKVALFLKILATGSLTMLLSACYGVVVAMYGVPSNSGGIVRVQKADGAPIPQIKISYKQWQTLGFADPQGILNHDLEWNEPTHVQLRFEDTDGTANGGTFAPAEVLVDEYQETVVLSPAVP